MKATYLTLITSTDQGIRNLKDSPQRASAWKKEAEPCDLRWLDCDQVEAPLMVAMN